MRERGARQINRQARPRDGRSEGDRSDSDSDLASGYSNDEETVDIEGMNQTQ